MKLSDIGEIQFLEKYLLPDVRSAEKDIGDDCAHLERPAGGLLWSIDPCPTPVAAFFNEATPDVYGWYTGLINLSDIAACGGTPHGMLVSLEMPNETELFFVEEFQRGLLSVLHASGASLLGGNVKSASKFAATGTILGFEGLNKVTRKIDTSVNCVYSIGSYGKFWTAVLSRYKNLSLTAELKRQTDDAFLFPRPQIEAGKRISQIEYPIACMDCSDGLANSLFQLAKINNLNIEITNKIENEIDKSIRDVFKEESFSVENACYQFGDWQLVCIIPLEFSRKFEADMSMFDVNKIGTTVIGQGKVSTSWGKFLNPAAINQNFKSGYNSISSVDSLIATFLKTEIFI